MVETLFGTHVDPDRIAFAEQCAKAIIARQSRNNAIQEMDAAEKQTLPGAAAEPAPAAAGSVSPVAKIEAADEQMSFAKRKAKEAAEQAAKAKESTSGVSRAASKESEKDKMRWEAVSTATISVTGLSRGHRSAIGRSETVLRPHSDCCCAVA